MLPTTTTTILLALSVRNYEKRIQLYFRNSRILPYGQHMNRSLSDSADRYISILKYPAQALKYKILKSFI